MTLTQKLVLYALSVALLPLAASGFTLVRLGEDAMRSRIEAHARTAAGAAASAIAQSVDELADRTVTAMELTDPLRLSPDERLGLLRLLHRQSSAVRTSVLLDAGGELLVRPVTAADPGAELDPEAARAAVARLRENLPVPKAVPARGREVLVSRPYFPARGPARIALAVGCCAGSGGVPRALAGLEVALDGALLRTSSIDMGERSRLFVVDHVGRVIAHPTLPVGTDLSAHPAVRALAEGRTAGNTRVTADEGPWSAAFASIPTLGWGVVVEQPEAVAFADAASMRLRTVSWITATTLLVVLTALAFATRLRRRITALMEGARAFAAGRLGERVVVPTADELGELAATLNGMAGDLQRSVAEIDAWGRTLEAKVDERTRELGQAQSQLLLQSKLAAIGQLGAGVAHEINNPLAGILGYAQLLLRRHKPGDDEWPSIKHIEEAAQRCRVVTTGLLRFSQRGVAGRSAVEVNELVGEVLDLMEGGLAEASIRIERELAPGAGRITADAGQLALVLINVVTNARNAMDGGGTLTVHTEGGPEDVRIRVGDTGHGIEPDHLPRIFDPFFTTKKNWSGVGLGLSVAYRVVTDHGGRIDVESAVGQGSRFTLVLLRTPPAPVVPGTARPRRPVLLA